MLILRTKLAGLCPPYAVFPHSRIAGTPMARFLKLLLQAFACAFALLFLAFPAIGADSEITIQNTAMQRMLMDQLFIDRGRFNLVRPSRCQYAYLESPAVTIAQGRVRIKSRLTGQMGIEVGGTCAAAGDVIDVTVSGRPYFSGENLGLTDIRVEEVSNELYRGMLQQALDVALPKALEINLREGLQQVMADQKSSYEVTVSKLTVTNLSAENNQIFANLSFTLSAR